MVKLDQWEAEIVRRESGGETNIKNPRSSAFGMFQMLIGNRVYYGNKLGINPHTVDRNEQILMGREYIKDRYSTSKKALDFWNKNGYY